MTCSQLIHNLFMTYRVIGRYGIRCNGPNQHCYYPTHLDHDYAYNSVILFSFSIDCYDQSDDIYPEDCKDQKEEQEKEYQEYCERFVLKENKHLFLGIMRILRTFLIILSPTTKQANLSSMVVTVYLIAPLPNMLTETANPALENTASHAISEGKNTVSTRNWCAMVTPNVTKVKMKSRMIIVSGNF